MSIQDLPRTIEIANNGKTVRIIDQTKLPYELSFITITNWQRLVGAMQRLEVRGAPALGVAGAAALCLFAYNQWRSSDASMKELSDVTKQISQARPTAVNLSWGVSRAEQAAKAIFQNEHSSSGRVTPDTPTFAKMRQAIKDEVDAIIAEDEASCRSIGAYGATLLAPSSRVLTHCNAGSLATSFYGTALGVIYSAFEQGKIDRVYADETRPVNQGARLTAWELAQVGVPTTLICDNMAASLMGKGGIDAIIVGADRICANGDAANKIGTYGLSILAQYHQVPFYIAAPLSTIDWNLSNGSEIEIEYRNAEEVLPRPILGVNVYNPAFDVTPAALIDAFITEKGVISPGELETLKQR